MRTLSLHAAPYVALSFMLCKRVSAPYSYVLDWLLPESIVVWRQK